MSHHRFVLILLLVGIVVPLLACGATGPEPGNTNSAETPITPSSNENSEPPEFAGIREFTISLVELIARPKDFDGKRVQVRGTLALGFEHNALYLHREDYDHGNVANAIWVDLPDELRGSSSRYRGKYVTIIGTFSARDHGHMGAFIGSITPEQID
jgi:hypothetical protein